MKRFAKGLAFLFYGIFLIIPWIYLLVEQKEKKEETSKNTEIPEIVNVPMTSEMMDLRGKYICPEDMAVLPSFETDEVWIVKTDGSHMKIKEKIRKYEAFCMDRYEYPNQKNVLPRTRVSYLEALELCKQNKKRLCNEFEWDFACSGKEKWAFSYGPSRQPYRCNTDGVQEGAFEWIAPSGSHPACHNPYGVYDLNGNVSEWVAMREHVNKGIVRGGTAWESAEYGQSCFSRHMHLVNDNSWPDDGFRCCKNARARQAEEIDKK